MSTNINNGKSVGAILLLLAFVIGFGQIGFADTNKPVLEKVVEIPLKKRSTPENIARQIKLPSGYEILPSFFFSHEKRKTNYLLVSIRRKKKDDEGHRRIHVFEQQTESKKQPRQIRVIEYLNQGEEKPIRLFWLNSRTKRGFVFQLPTLFLTLYALPDESETKVKDMKVTQSFVTHSDGLGVTDYFVWHTDSRGFLTVVEKPGNIASDGVTYSETEYQWFWNGKSWVRQSERLN